MIKNAGINAFLIMVFAARQKDFHPYCWQKKHKKTIVIISNDG